MDLLDDSASFNIGLPLLLQFCLHLNNNKRIEAFFSHSFAKPARVFRYILLQILTLFENGSSDGDDNDDDNNDDDSSNYDDGRETGAT